MGKLFLVLLLHQHIMLPLLLLLLLHFMLMLLLLAALVTSCAIPCSPFLVMCGPHLPLQ